MKISTVLLALVLATGSAWAGWSSCSSDLYDLKRAADWASDYAGKLNNAEQELNICRSGSQSCHVQLSAYQTALTQFQGELDTVKSRFKRTSSSCGVERIDSGADGQTRDSRLCEAIKRNANSLPASYTMNLCKSYLSEAQCKKCLE